MSGGAPDIASCTRSVEVDARSALAGDGSASVDASGPEAAAARRRSGAPGEGAQFAGGLRVACAVARAAADRCHAAAACSASAGGGPVAAVGAPAARHRASPSPSPSAARARQRHPSPRRCAPNPEVRRRARGDDDAASGRDASAAAAVATPTTTAPPAARAMRAGWRVRARAGPRSQRGAGEHLVLQQREAQQLGAPWRRPICRRPSARRAEAREQVDRRQPRLARLQPLEHRAGRARIALPSP